MKIPKIGLVVAPLIVTWPLCPESESEPVTHEHPPHEDHRPVPTRGGFELYTSAPSSTSDVWPAARVASLPTFKLR
jgi:hypothetical protein